MNPSDPPRPARRWFGLLRWVLFIVTPLLFAEGLARYYISGPLPMLRRSADPVLLTELVPGHFRSDGYLIRRPAVSYTIDEHGCRVVGDAPAKQGKEVLFLGSSHVFGILNEDTETIPEVAIADIQERHPEASLIPRNCSVPGHVLAQTLYQAAILGNTMDVESIAILVAPKHGDTAFDWSSLEPSPGLMRKMTEHSRLARLVHLVTVIRKNHFFPALPEDVELLGQRMDSLSQTAKSRGIRVAVFVIDEFRHPDFNVAEESLQRGFEVIRLASPPRNDLRYMDADGDHWSAQGLRFMAQRMIPGLEDLLHLSNTAAQQ